MDVKSWDTSASNNNASPPDGAGEDLVTLKDMNNILREFQAVLARWHKDINGSLATTNAGNAYSVTLNQSSYTAYEAGLVFAATVNSANTGNATINVNGAGAKSWVYPDGSEIPAGRLQPDMTVWSYYSVNNDRVEIVGGLVLPYIDPLTTRGDLLLRDASTTARLAVGAAARYLRSDGTDPAWSQLLLADLLVASGAAGDILQHNGTNLARLPIGTAGQLLAVNSGATAVEYVDEKKSVDYGAKTLSGATEYEWTSIASDIVSLDLSLISASLDGAEHIHILLGTSVEYVETGYLSRALVPGAGADVITTALRPNLYNDASYAISGEVRLLHNGSNRWLATGLSTPDSLSATSLLTGHIALGGPLTRIKILSETSAAFDGGHAHLRGYK